MNLEAFAAVNTPEWLWYLSWYEKDKTRRYGQAAQTGALHGFRAGRASTVSWETITTAQRLEHIEACPVCVFCETGRAWGRCTSCNDMKEALPPFGESRCCGSPVTFAAEVS